MVNLSHSQLITAVFLLVSINSSHITIS